MGQTVRVRRSHGWILLGTAAVAVGGLAWFAIGDNEPQRECAGVGLTTQITRSTPDDAMSAWVRSQGGDPMDWASGGKRLNNAHHPRTAVAEPKGYIEIAAREISPGVWRVYGACAK
jgi:hypothetical protein